MVLDQYPKLVQIFIMLVAIAIATSLIYAIISSGAIPLVQEQTGTYDGMITNSTKTVGNLVNDSNKFQFDYVS